VKTLIDLRLLIALTLVFTTLAGIWVGSAVAAERPKIGLALSGGGARGAAHVGVLRRVEALGIPVDFIAGTSMGSIVGGLYAMGMSPDEIEAVIEEIDWDGIFDDEPAREDRRLRRKDDDRTFLIKGKAGVIEHQRKVELVPALVQGQKLELALRKYTLPASEIRDFDRLRIPFRAVATDIETGDAVILDGGDLAASMRASMAVPAIFAPVAIGNRLLVDGGLAMNLPVEVVRDMGADIVIAVDVGGPRRQRDEITNVLAMLDQVASLVTFRNTQDQIDTLGTRDVLIVPPLGRKVLASDFGKMIEAIAIGEEGADAQRARLAVLGLSPQAYAEYRDARRPPVYEAPIVDFVRLDNNSRLADEVVWSRIQVEPGTRLDPVAIERQLGSVYDQDSFQSVRYHLETRDGETGVVITANEKPWGTSWLQAGLELSSTTGGDSRFNIGAAYTMAPVNRLNGEWRTQFQIGEEPEIFTEIYQPLDPAERWYGRLGAGYLSENLRVFTPKSQKNPEAEYQLTRWGGLLEGGRNLGDWGRLGLRYSRLAGDADVRLGAPGFSGFNFDVGELEAMAQVDSLDSLNFPRSGWVGQAFAVTSRDWLGASDDYDLLGLELLHAGTWGRDSLLTGLSLAGNLGGETPLQAYYRLGGLMNLSGFNQGELSGPYAGLARAIYLRNLGTGLVTTYAGASLELGNTWQEREEIGLDDTRVAGSLFLGADTILGPVYLGYGQADGGNAAIYLYLGQPWLPGLRP
jgi:NTE family protein